MVKKKLMNFILHVLADRQPHSAEDVAKRMNLKQSFVYGNLITLSMNNRIDRIVSSAGDVRFIKID